MTLTQSPFSFFDNPSHHPVGLQVIEQYDYSRSYRLTTDIFGKPYQGERARPLQTLIWYPAAPSDRTPMTVRDYVSLVSSETGFGKQSTASAAPEEWLMGMAQSLATPLWAVRDAPWASGRFPVVIYAPGFSCVSWENADLCEYLASHGYVVVASPNMGATTRSMTYDLRGIDTQARDISFLIGFVHSIAAADVSAIGVVGFSWGGISNVFAAARDNRISALVALDGGLRFSPGFVTQAGDVQPQDMRIPLLSIAQGQWTFEDHERCTRASGRQGPNVLNAWTHGDLTAVNMLGMAHGEFGSMYQRNEDTWNAFFDGWHRRKGGYARKEVVTSYTWMARYTLEFLNAYLKKDAASLSFLKRAPADNGVPPHIMAATFRQATQMPASFEGFRLEIGRRGFDHATEIYEEFRCRAPEFELADHLVGSWSEELMDEGYQAEALLLLQLNVRMHPHSSVTYTRLAEAYRKAGRPQKAIEALRTALEKNPVDPSSEEILMRIDALAGH